MADNSDSASAERLEELRERGLVPYSPFATSLICLAGCLLAILSLKDSINNNFIVVLKSLRDMNFEDLYLSQSFIEALSELTLCGAAMLIMSLVFALFGGLLQTKFLMRTENLGFDLGRLVPDLSNPAAIFGRIGALFSILLITLALACLSLYLQIPRALGMLNLDQSSILASAGELVNNGVEGSIAVALAAAFVSWLLAKVIFLRRHRMSKEEIERGARR